MKTAWCVKCDLPVDFERDYGLENWNTHKAECTGCADLMFSHFIPRVLTSCGILSTNTLPRIDLTKVAQRSLNSIPKQTPKPTASASTSKPRSKAEAAPRHSPSATSDDTLIAIEGSPSASRGQKRTREEDDLQSDRQLNRARKEDYVPPVNEQLGAWGWLLLPITSLVSGFREGMRSSSS